MWRPKSSCWKKKTFSTSEYHGFFAFVFVFMKPISFRSLIGVLLLGPLAFGQHQGSEGRSLDIDSVAQSVLSAPYDSLRLQANALLLDFLIDTLSHPSSYEQDFDSFKSISRLRAPDDRFVLWTWQLPRKGGRFHHQGLVVLPGEEANRVILLSDTGNHSAPPLYRPLRPGQWQGAVYYHIEKVRHKKEAYYMLLGYDQHDLRTRRKWIDVIALDPQHAGGIVFGADIFRIDDFQGRVMPRKPYRLLLEYSAKLSASLRWSDGRIIMDHLAPQDASMKRMYSFYGPDFTYDALYWNKGHWKLEEQIEAPSDIPARIALPDRGSDLAPGEQRK
jgi:hypothetical protein